MSNQDSIKVIIQIPCFNEEQTLPITLADLPSHIDGVDIIETLIIDDGSTDKTLEVARAAGVDHIVRNKRNMGLARSFRRGIEAALALGADIIVNTDGDNQYVGEDVALLVGPILSGRAEIVIGDRQTHLIEHFSPLKKVLQWVGSAIVRRLAGIAVPDTVSGFRAFSREAAIKLNIVSGYSYTIETVIQAGKRDMAVESVPVRTNGELRKSRLFTSTPMFIQRQVSTILRMYAMYQPLKVFFYVGMGFTVIGMLPICRFLYFYFTDGGAGNIQSLLLGSVLLIMGFIAFVAGLVTDLIAANRQLLEMTLERVKRMEIENAVAKPPRQ
ncbi:glycosyltransferase family 2 protein [Congregibacter variabilis]|uniref:Glycosyltransferase family 2 protein n=1 Tax=Congregibacter variabilis TaxID=3081200 RepID=A0ABZ0I0F3_9GAMM|nr:glycosyltransferase family 2 protein [Congregibacter sp. IMCC43200]